jgi:Recombination endonuclease VII
MSVATDTKVCTRCKVVKPCSEFHVNRAKNDGLAIYCKPCMNGMTRRHYKKNRDARLDYARVRNFGISREQYEEMLKRQNGVCAICHQPETARSRSGGEKLLGVDHEHETGRVRGLLCYRCNVALGYLKDDADVLLSAVAYLRGDD